MYIEGIAGFHPLFSLILCLGFIAELLGGLQIAAPFLGKLFGGGAPTFKDLPKNLQGASQMTVDALRQSQELRGGQINLAQQIQERDSENARKIGFFDPTSLGPEFNFLKKQQRQFKGVDLSAKSIKDLFDRKQQITQLAQQIGQQSPQLELGIANLLAQAAQTTGGGLGGAIGGVAGLLSSGLAQSKAGGGGGGILDILKGIGGGFAGGPQGASGEQFLDLPGAQQFNPQGGGGFGDAPPTDPGSFTSAGGNSLFGPPPESQLPPGVSFDQNGQLDLESVMNNPAFSALIQAIINQAAQRER